MPPASARRHAHPNPNLPTAADQNEVQATAACRAFLEGCAAALAANASAYGALANEPCLQGANGCAGACARLPPQHCSMGACVGAAPAALSGAAGGALGKGAHVPCPLAWSVHRAPKPPLAPLGPTPNPTWADATHQPIFQPHPPRCCELVRALLQEESGKMLILPCLFSCQQVGRRPGQGFGEGAGAAARDRRRGGAARCPQARLLGLLCR